MTEDISNIGQQQVLNNVLSQEKQQSPKQASDHYANFGIENMF